MTDLETWLAQIETQHPQTIELELSRMRAMIAQLDLPSFDCPVIVVGGTNGKGSCVTLLAAIYHRMGYRVGSYTSPHLFKFNERICIDEQPVSDDQFIAAFELIEQRRGTITLTFFEFTTLAAFVIFHQAALDVVILEVGLGGRFDAVNIIDADVSVITNVALDHCDFLGSNREAIAYEKAGIMRPAHPILFGEADVPLAIVQQAHQLNADLYVLGEQIQWRTQSDQWEVQLDDTHYLLPVSSLNKESVLLAVSAVHLLAARLPFTQSIVQQAAAQTRLFGRQHIRGAYLFDVAHNPAAAQRLSEWLVTVQCSGQRYAIFSCCADKDIVGVLTPLALAIDHWFIAPFNGKRSASSTQLQQAIATLTTSYTVGNDLFSVTQQAQSQLAPTDQLLIFGSFYTVEQVWSFLT